MLDRMKLECPFYHYLGSERHFLQRDRGCRNACQAHVSIAVSCALSAGVSPRTTARRWRRREGPGRRRPGPWPDRPDAPSLGVVHGGLPVHATTQPSVFGLSDCYWRQVLSRLRNCNRAGVKGLQESGTGPPTLTAHYVRRFGGTAFADRSHDVARPAGAASRLRSSRFGGPGLRERFAKAGGLSRTISATGASEWCEDIGSRSAESGPRRSTTSLPLLTCANWETHVTVARSVSRLREMTRNAF